MKMRVYSIDQITRETGSVYSKIVFHSGHYALINEDEFTISVCTPTGKTASIRIKDSAVKAIINFYE